MPPGFPAACVLGTLLLLGCGSTPETALARTRGYILISIDTLRADHLGCYGYDRDTSPYLDALAARGVLFERAFSQIPATLESHMSIFTGLYPTEHGVVSPVGTLSEEIETLPEIFRRHGFRTGGHTEGGYVHGGYGFARGFDDFSDAALKIESDVERTLARGLAFLESLGEEEPFFLFLHTYAVHDPYYPPEPYSSRYWEGPPPPAFKATGPNFTAFNRGELEMSDEALAYYRASYDASIRYADERIGGFFADLERLDLADDTTVIITSDHGEEFREHGKMVHEQVYRETLHVPLILLHPNVAEPRRVSAIVESIDIAPTLHRLAGLTARGPLSGEDLGQWLDGRGPRRAEAFASGAGGLTRSLIRGRGEDLYQLVFFDPAAQTPWVSLERSFDTIERELRFEAQAYHEAREVAVSVDGREVSRARVPPDRWLALEIPPLDGRRHRVSVTSPTCTVPAEIGESADARCLSFRTRGSSMASWRLFDLAADPLGARDLAPAERQLAARLVDGLELYARGPVATPSKTALDPDLERHLKSLGYLQ
jgi:hypothetical protein